MKLSVKGCRGLSRAVVNTSPSNPPQRSETERGSRAGSGGQEHGPTFSTGGPDRRQTSEHAGIRAVTRTRTKSYVRLSSAACGEGFQVDGRLILDERGHVSQFPQPPGSRGHLDTRKVAILPRSLLLRHIRISRGHCWHAARPFQRFVTPGRTPESWMSQMGRSLPRMRGPDGVVSYTCADPSRP